jgi:hypothetical protein
MEEHLGSPHEIYTNSVQISASVYEMALTFGLMDPDTEETKLLTRVRMSPQHAQALYLLLGKYLKGYKDRFGEILLPDELVSALGEDKSREEGSNDAENH